jgi:hypothetical protein
MPFSKAALLLNYLDSEQLALDLHPLLSVAEDCITMVNNLRAGEGAKAEILTRMIYPRRNVPDKKEKSIVILIEEKTIEINKKQQQCYTFKIEKSRPYLSLKVAANRLILARWLAFKR